MPEQKKERDFTQPLEADFIVSLKAKNKDYCLFVEAFFRRNGKDYLRHTTELSHAKRFGKLTAMEVVEQVKEYRCIGRVERVLPDNSRVVVAYGNELVSR